MWVIWVDVLAVLVGLLLLGRVAWGLFRQVKSLGRTVAAASEQITRASDELAKVAPPTDRP